MVYYINTVVGIFIYHYGTCSTNRVYKKDAAYLVDENQHVCALYNVTFNTTQQSLTTGPNPCSESSSDNALADCSDVSVSMDATPVCVYGVHSNREKQDAWTIECHSTKFCHHTSEFNSILSPQSNTIIHVLIIHQLTVCITIHIIIILFV